MEKDNAPIVEKILQSEKLAERKLIRKIYFIVFAMIFVLTTIIIVEFKEYSNNYTEYKIGLSELGPKDLVWAGIMGTPPRYFESNEKHGFGYKEFDTREIRKALEEAGINLIYRYMSPNRLEFEFERKHPICFYDKQWSNPKEYFKKKRHAILSIPRYYSGEEFKKIFFRKGEKPRFEKHLDAKGNINLESLIKDTSLKTELIRKVEYDGPYANVTYGKRQLDGTFYDYVKPKYKKNIDLVILHTNDQIIQMLKWKRFDYQFWDTLEPDDFPWMDGNEKGIETLIYDVKTVKSIDDPNLTFHSVACGNHPLVKLAMPIINEVIKSIRFDPRNYNRSYYNQIKLKSLKVATLFATSLGSMALFGNSITQSDKWYDYQFTVNNNLPWPMFNEKVKTSPFVIKKNLATILNATSTNNVANMPYWNVIERENSLGEKSIVIINDVDIKNKLEEKIIVNGFLDEEYNLEKNNSIDRKLNFKDLSFFKENSYVKIIIFARGIKDREFELLKPLFDSPLLKSITILESSLYQSKLFINYIPKQLEQLRLYDVPLMGLTLSQKIHKMNGLKDFDLQASDNKNIPLMIEKKELIDIINYLPSTLEGLSIVGRGDLYKSSFPIQAAEAFVKKKFSHLKRFTLLNLFLGKNISPLIMDALPLRLESFIIGIVANNLKIGDGISSLLLEEFLSKRKAQNTLKRLRVHRMVFSFRTENKIYLPESLEDLLISQSVGLNDGNFHRIIIPLKMKLKQLAITYCELNDFSIYKLLIHLDTQVKNLNLSNNKLTGNAFFKLLQKNPLHLKTKEIEKFSLKSNPVNDFGMMSLSKLPWKIKQINLSNLQISDRSTNYLMANKFWDLTSLDLSDNYLSANSINKILGKFAKNLQEIMLNNVLSLDIKKLSEYISPQMKILSLAGNMLNDLDISILMKKLPRDLNYLDITGSFVGAKGALLLAQKMPNLSKFYFDLKLRESEESLNYVFNSLSPNLTSMSSLDYTLSYENLRLLSKHMPIYLYDLSIKDFETEEGKILLGSLPASLRMFSIGGNIKSKGESLKELANSLPSHLVKIMLHDFSPQERDPFLKRIENHYIEIFPTAHMSAYSRQLVKAQSIYPFLGHGVFKAEYFKEINLPSHVMIVNLQNDLQTGFLDSLSKVQLSELRSIGISNCKNFSNQEIFNFLKKLPAHFEGMRLSNTNISEKEVSEFLHLLPKNLTFLNIIGNSFGEEGLKLIKEYKRKKEEESGLPFIILDEKH